MDNPDPSPASAASPPAEMTGILHRLLVRNGTTLLDDRARLLALLTEQAPSEGRAVRLLMSAYDLEVPQHLLDDNGTPPALKVEHDVNALVSETGLQADLARWAVLAWGTALGIALPDGATPIAAPTAASPSVTLAAPAISAAPAASADDLTWGDDLPAVTQPSPTLIATPAAMPSAPPYPQAAFPQPIPQRPFFKSPLGIVAIVVVLLAIAFLIANHFFHWEMLELWDDFYFAFLYDLFN